jgi:hypothetical protein
VRRSSSTDRAPRTLTHPRWPRSARPGQAQIRSASWEPSIHCSRVAPPVEVPPCPRTSLPASPRQSSTPPRDQNTDACGATRDCSSGAHCSHTVPPRCPSHTPKRIWYTLRRTHATQIEDGHAPGGKLSQRGQHRMDEQTYGGANTGRLHASIQTLYNRVSYLGALQAFFLSEEALLRLRAQHLMVLIECGHSHGGAARNVF